MNLILSKIGRKAGPNITTRRHLLAWLVAFLGLTGLLCACGAATPTPIATPAPTISAQGGYLDTLRQKGRITIGVKYDTPGFGLLNSATGQVEGFDADIGREIAAAIFGDPNKADLVEIIDNNRIPFLQNDQLDLVIATMTINEERKQLIDFSDVYYQTGQGVLTKQDRPYKNLDDFKDRPVCTVQGSTSVDNLRVKAPTMNLKLFGSYLECFTALESGQVEAMTTDEGILFGYEYQNPNKYKLVGGQFSREPYGIAIKKGRPELLGVVNRVLAAMKADGRWKALYAKNIAPFTRNVPDPPQ